MSLWCIEGTAEYYVEQQIHLYHDRHGRKSIYAIEMGWVVKVYHWTKFGIFFFHFYLLVHRRSKDHSLESLQHPYLIWRIDPWIKCLPMVMPPNRYMFHQHDVIGHYLNEWKNTFWKYFILGNWIVRRRWKHILSNSTIRGFMCWSVFILNRTQMTWNWMTT